MKGKISPTSLYFQNPNEHKIFQN